MKKIVLAMSVILLGLSVTSCTASDGPRIPTESSSSSAPRNPLLRVPLDTVIGDPVGDDLCAITPRRTFAGRWRDPTLDPIQRAGWCFYDLYDDGGSAFQVATTAYSALDFSSVAATAGKKSGDLTLYPPVQGDKYCSQAVADSDVVFETFAQSFDGHVGMTTLCAAAGVAISAYAQALQKHVAPKLILPRTTVTRFDQCALLTSDRVTRDPAVGTTIDHQRGAVACSAAGSSAQQATVTLDVVYVEPGALDDTTSVTVGARRFRVDASHGQCVVYSSRDLLPGTERREYLKVYVEQTTGSCQTAQRAAAAALDTAGLK